MFLLYPAAICMLTKLTIETLEQGVKYVPLSSELKWSQTWFGLCWKEKLLVYKLSLFWVLLCHETPRPTAGGSSLYNHFLGHRCPVVVKELNSLNFYHRFVNQFFLLIDDMKILGTVQNKNAIPRKWREISVTEKKKKLSLIFIFSRCNISENYHCLKKCY